MSTTQGAHVNNRDPTNQYLAPIKSINAMKVSLYWMLLISFWIISLGSLSHLYAAETPSTIVQVQSREPPSEPILRIEAGMHTAMINRIDVDMNGQVAVTVSDDKTARLWSLPDGRLLSTLRIPIGYGFNGALYATALSPDGKHVWVSGITGIGWDKVYSAYLFDTVTGKPIGLITDHKSVIIHMVYSLDGQRFAVAAADGLYLYDNFGKIIAQDLDYGAPLNWVSFDSRGRLATSSMDGYVRLYSQDVKLLAKHKLPEKERPWSVEFSSDNSLLAVGSYDKARVEILSVPDLNLKHTPDTSGIDQGSLSVVSWISNASESVLIAGGTAIAKKGDSRVIRAWSKGGRGAFHDMAAPGLGVNQIKPVTGLGALYVTNNSWGVIYNAGKTLRLAEKRRSPSANINGKIAISDDGMIVEFFESGGSSYQFDVRSASLSRITSLNPTLTYAVLNNSSSIIVTNWRNSSKPMLNGQSIPLDQNELSKSLAIAPDGESFLLGTGFHLLHINKNGKLIKSVNMPAAVEGLVISKISQLAVAALDDGTLRWYRLTKESPLQELMSFFVDATNPSRWIAWTPEGFFDHGARGGKDLVGFHINKGARKGPEWVGVDQLYTKLHSSSMLIKKLSGQPADETAIQNRIKENGDLSAFLMEGRMPVATPLEFCYTARQGDGKELCQSIQAAMALQTRGRGRETSEPTQQTTAIKDNKSIGDVAQPVGCNLASESSEPQTRGRLRDFESTEASPAKAEDGTITTATQPLVVCSIPEGSENVKIRYQVVDRGGGFGKNTFFVNGLNVDEQLETKGRSRDTDPPTNQPSSKSGQQDKSITVEQMVKFHDKKNIVSARFYEKTNKIHGAVTPIEFKVVTDLKSRGPEKKIPKPRMILLASGINEYKKFGDSDWARLDFVIKDVIGVVNSFHERRGKLFEQFLTVNPPNAKNEIVFTEFKKGDLQSNMLFDKQVSKDNLLKALDALVDTVQSNDDTVIIYLGGHGVNINNQFYYIPIDLKSNKDEDIVKLGLSGQEMLARIRMINAKMGKVLLILDTCYGGSISFDGIDDLNNLAGIFMIGAATSTQTAFDEYPGSGHGLFAYTFMQGLDEKVIQTENTGNVNNLGGYVKTGVYANWQKMAEKVGSPIARQNASFRTASDSLPFPVAQAQIVNK